MVPTTRALVIAAVIGLAQLAGLIWLFVRRETVVPVIVAGLVGLLVGVLMFLLRREAGVAAVIGGALAIVTGCSLLLMALPEDPAVVLILAPPILGGIVALLNPGSRWALGGSMLLVLAGAYLTLIGGEGLLYLPVVVALSYGMLGPSPAGPT